MRNYLALLALLATAAPALAAPAATKAASTRFDAVIAQYEIVRTALLTDSWNATAATAAQRLQGELEALAAEPTAAAAAVPADKLAVVQALLPEARRQAQQLAAAKELGPARDAFYRLTLPLVRWRGATGRPAPVVAFCSMSQRSWLQPKEAAIGNPYYGKKMATCGEVVR